MTKEALKLALEALSVLKPDNWVDKELQGRAWDAVKKALAQPEQEPVANIRIWHKNGEQHAELWNWDKGIEALPDGDYDLYTTPPQPEQEPVAIKCMKEWIEYLKRKSDFGQHMKIPSEMSAGTCWELAIELEQFINTTPAQRTWVNLTDEDRNDCLVEADPCECLATPEAQELMRCVEAKSKE